MVAGGSGCAEARLDLFNLRLRVPRFTCSRGSALPPLCDPLLKIGEPSDLALVGLLRLALRPNFWGLGDNLFGDDELGDDEHAEAAGVEGELARMTETSREGNSVCDGWQLSS